MKLNEIRQMARTKKKIEIPAETYNRQPIVRSERLSDYDSIDINELATTHQAKVNPRLSVEVDRYYDETEVAVILSWDDLETDKEMSVRIKRVEDDFKRAEALRIKRQEEQIANDLKEYERLKKKLKL